eukprot:m.83978 g.83978  ORF g.83978 m.83978 type:complete len:121 (-) comp12948_c0_seq2:109-471(-)
MVITTYRCDCKQGFTVCVQSFFSFIKQRNVRRSRRDQVRENEKWPKLDTAEIDDVERDNVTTAPDRIQFKGEFERLMKEHFLAGDDQEFFDYSVVDNNSEYDDLDIKGRDAEEAYFDDSD